MQLARVLVLLPSRRAERALTEAFVRLSDGKALLLPRMAPAGDIDADEALGSFADSLDGVADIAPEMPARARRLALAKLLARGRGLPGAEALVLAGQLAIALDTLEIEGKTTLDVREAVPAAMLEEHWRVNAELLDALLHGWPDVLAARGRMDGAARRNRLLALLADRWSRTPPDHPVVLAGFASAPPAVARLARVVARLPRAMLVLPGLDSAIDADTWALIGGGIETHPQFGMARLLAIAGLSPQEADIWPAAPGVEGSSPARGQLVARAMIPATLSGARAEPASAAALSGLRMVEAASPAEEALAIAIALRQVVERPGRSAALVTPDRSLARRVTVQLKRFGIDIDDSAGVALGDTLPGSLLIAIATAAGERFAPVPLLALLQHPLVRAGERRLPWLNAVRALDLLALRGLRPAPGLDGIARRLKTARPADKARASVVHDWWAAEVVPTLAALQPVASDGWALVQTIRTVAEALAGPAIWSGDSGRALAQFLDGLGECEADLSALPVGADDAAAVLSALMRGETVRPRWRRHPQLAIWGPLEARLQSADLLIMGGLNEGVWPGTPAPDPFLAPAIRRALGLPGLARRTGMQAHDFAMGLGVPEVLLTRSARESGAPSVPSRFWQRLEASAGSRPDSGDLAPSGAALLQAARSLCRSAHVRFDRPAPSPPAADRPRKLSVTEVSGLKADPFAFYARHMLKLKPLDPRDAEPTGGDRGTVVHRIMERWLNGDQARMPLDALVDEEMAKLGDRPELAALWRPRVMRMANFVLQTLASEADWTPFAIERRGALERFGVTLTGQADRIDRSRSSDGPCARLRIVDYKTGALPSVKDVAGLWQTQLALLAFLAEEGGFPDVPQGDVVKLDYMHLSGGSKPGSVRPGLGQKATLQELADHKDKAVADYRDLVGRYLLGDSPFTAKQNMVHGRRYQDYDLLARVAEWLGRA